MKDPDITQQLNEYEDEILNIIKDGDDITQSDVQGMVSILVKQIYHLGKAQGIEEGVKTTIASIDEVK